STFVPPPKVTSSVVRLLPRASPLPCASSALERVTAAAFGQRRKMLRQSLRALGTDPQPILAAAGIDPAVRAAEISVQGFVVLASRPGYTALPTQNTNKTPPHEGAHARSFPHHGKCSDADDQFALTGRRVDHMIRKRASKSGGMTAAPARAPALRPIMRQREGTSRATGLPALAMMISSPAAARSTSREKCFLAS